jgi:chorismate mutase/prephenate dehydratase
MNSSLERSRKAIEIFDEKLLEVLWLRMGEVKTIGKYKIKNGLPVKDRERERELIASLIEKGKKIGIKSEVVKNIFKTIIKESCKEQERMVRK